MIYFRYCHTLYNVEVSSALRKFLLPVDISIREKHKPQPNFRKCQTNCHPPCITKISSFPYMDFIYLATTRKVVLQLNYCFFFFHKLMEIAFNWRQDTHLLIYRKSDVGCGRHRRKWTSAYVYEQRNSIAKTCVETIEG